MESELPSEKFRSIGDTNLISVIYQKRTASCLSHRRIFRGTRYCFLATHSVTFFQRFGSVIVQEAKTLIIFCWQFFFVTMIVSSVLVPTKLLWPLVVRSVIVRKRHFLFRVSSRFWSEVKLTRRFCFSFSWMKMYPR